jgi:hypothetical protein
MAALLHRWKLGVVETINYKLRLSRDSAGLHEEIIDRIVSTGVGHRRRREDNSDQRLGSDQNPLFDLTIHAKQRSH